MWSQSKIARFYVNRGLALLFIQHFIENPAWLLGIVSMDPAILEKQITLDGVASRDGEGAQSHVALRH